MAHVRQLFLWTAPLYLALGCLSPPVETPQNLVVQTQTLSPLDNNTNEIDVLFMVDNSSSMTAMQSQLQAHFGDFLNVFSQLSSMGINADLHIGVVTSDYGAGDIGYRANNIGCDASPGGQRGLLQTMPASSLNITNCAPPTQGKSYIEYSYAPGGTNNLPAGQTLAQTFTCMASVGSSGCGFEHQLESVRAALQQTTAQGGTLNGDFLRPEAYLAIVFVTNEDDGSAPPTSHIYEEMNNNFGYYDTYRQTHWGVDCTQAGVRASAPYPLTLPVDNSGNPVPIDLTADACAGAPNPGAANVDLEFDVNDYIKYFTSLKKNPAQVVLVGIDGPTSPFRVILAKQGTGQGLAPAPQYQTCDQFDPTGSCTVRLDHSCQNVADPAFFADPPVRLSAVINNGLTGGDEEPICGSDLNQEPDYTASMQKVGALIAKQLSPGCIPGHLTSTVKPDCSAIDHDTVAGTQTTIPECNQGGTTQPTYNGQLPCWIIQPKALCAPGSPNGSPDGLGMTIVRASPAPSTTYATVQCATIAEPADGGI